MAKKMVLLALCCVCMGLAACGTVNDDSDAAQSESVAATQTEQTSKPTEDTSSAQAEDIGSQAAEPSSEAETEQTTTQTDDPQSGQTEDTSSDGQTENVSETLTEDQALAAIKNYCFKNNPDLQSMVDSGEYDISWEVSTNESGEIVVLYRSYTAAQIRYYIDPASGETYVTELVPGIIDEEQRTDESFNVKDHLE